ncbi:hypothetical protein [Photobacterium kishitanii]|uniref:hypothetical protein n=1 Tax=Photobacterium kishitanii TaxID=318456 RepID=UPI00273942B2|nr:hypothetical protein [Photobacterium kishitanii]
MKTINPKLLAETAENQDKILAEFEHDIELTRRHCAQVHFVSEHIYRPDSYRSIDDPLYRDPTGEEIKEVFEHLASLHSKGIVTKMLGIRGTSNPTRTITRWIDGTNTIPYAAWRLLLILDGRVVETSRIPAADGSKPWEQFYTARAK